MKNFGKVLLICAAMICTTQLFAQSRRERAWFSSEEWLQGAEMTPAPSIDIETFAKHYKKHPNRWNTVFQTLSNCDLETLPLGLTQLTNDVKMNVQEYTTRPTVGKRVLYEKHDEWIDVQCVITGEELHGKSHLKGAGVVKEYNEKNDIAMYSCVNVPFYIIGSKMFTIFFPHELHTTNYGFGELSKVRKIVFKVRYK